MKQSARLLRELNEANSNLLDGRIYWRGGLVIVETSLAELVDARSSFAACMTVGSAADDLGALLAAMFDGSTPFLAEVGA